MLEIREASETDFDKIWPIFQAIVSAGDTNAYPTDVTKAEGKRFGLDTPRKTFVAEDDGELLGSYYIKTNQAGPGAHVCTCGYMVAASARARGIATAMCKHSQTIALELGYEAMQFNFVASSNQSGVGSGRRTPEFLLIKPAGYDLSILIRETRLIIFLDFDCLQGKMASPRGGHLIPQIQLVSRMIITF